MEEKKETTEASAIKTEMEEEIVVAKIGNATEKHIAEISSTQCAKLLVQAIN